jgi:hypothetical protein
MGFTARFVHSLYTMLAEGMSHQPDNIFAGTQVVSLVEVRGTSQSLIYPRAAMRVEAHRDRLLAVKRGAMAWPEVDAWRKDLHRDFARALAETKLPERPDYGAANLFLVKARREMAKDKVQAANQ